MSVRKDQNSTFILGQGKPSGANREEAWFTRYIVGNNSSSMDKNENKTGNAAESSLQEKVFEDLNDVVYQHQENSEEYFIDNLPDAHPEPRPAIREKE